MEEKQCNEKIRKVFLDDLPRYKEGRNKNKINWSDSVGYSIRFTYDNTEGLIKISKYSHEYLYIEYNDCKDFRINITSFSRCNLGKLISKANKNFEIRIGQTFKDNKRNITITNLIHTKDKNNNNKTYCKYHCHKCGFDCGKHWYKGEYMKECYSDKASILNGTGCACCCENPNIIVQGINDIPTTAPWMIPYFQGGIEEAKRYTHGSGKKIYPKCPDCGRVKSKSVIINTIHKNHSIGCSCNDNISYSEKIIFGILNQTNIDFEFQLSKKILEWCNKYKYDFSFVKDNERYIIETHGRQHYEDAWDNLKKTQENDRVKKDLVLNNGIKEENYIVIDCRKSELDWIKQNVFNSKLNELFNLSIIDWNKAEEFACNNLVKTVCKIKKDNPDITASEIKAITKLSLVCIIKYLKIGNLQKWCNYNPNEEIIKKNVKLGLMSEKSIEVFKGEVSMGIFKSGTEIIKNSERLFGVKFSRAGISRSCNNMVRSYKGFVFNFV